MGEKSPSGLDFIPLDLGLIPRVEDSLCVSLKDTGFPEYVIKNFRYPSSIMDTLQ